MKRSGIPTLDIVTSAKNEELNIPILYAQIRDVMVTERYAWRLIVCDNDSTDKTWSVIEGLAAKHENVSGFQMSRDFGFEASIFAAIKNSSANERSLLFFQPKRSKLFVDLLLAA